MSTIELNNGNKMFIREAMPEDATQLLTLSKSVGEAEHYMVTRAEELNLTVAEERKWMEEHMDNLGVVIFVAGLDKRIVGFVNFINGTRHRSVTHKLCILRYKEDIFYSYMLVCIACQFSFILHNEF